MKRREGGKHRFHDTYNRPGSGLNCGASETISGYCGGGFWTVPR